MSNTDFGGTSGGARATGEGGSPKEIAKAAVQSVKQEAASFADSAKDKVADRATQAKQTATETLGDFANAIRKAGDELAEKDRSLAGRMVKQAADSLEGLSRSVSDKQPEELIDAVRDFGRQNPGAFIAGSVLLGLAIGRFARSSRQHDTGQGEGQGYGQGASGYMPSQDYGSPGEYAGAGGLGGGLGQDGGAMNTPGGLEPRTSDRFQTEA